MNIQQLLELTITRNASDLHLSVGYPPILRIHGELIPIPGEDPIAPEVVESLLAPLINETQKNIISGNWKQMEINGKIWKVQVENLDFWNR